jgi:hypothetical protein
VDLNELAGVDLSVMRRGGGRRGSAFRVSRARGEARSREAVEGGRASVEGRGGELGRWCGGGDGGLEVSAKGKMVETDGFGHCLHKPCRSFKLGFNNTSVETLNMLAN